MNKRMKKHILLPLSLIMAISISGCMPKELREEVASLEAEAKDKMDDFLDKEFSDYKITEVEQIVSGNAIEGWDISQDTRFEVKIDGDNYVFVYSASDDTYWSNYYYGEIIEDFKDMLDEYDALEDADSCELNIGMKVSGPNVYVLLHEDKDLESVIEREEDGECYYESEAFYYYSNERDFCPKELELDSIYEDISNLHLVLYNTDGDGRDRDNIIDTIECNDYHYDEDEIYITYYHNKWVEIGEMKFSYNDNYYDVEITPIDYDNDDPPRKYYTEVDFKYNDEAYAIEADRVGDIELDRGNYNESYINENDVTVHITESNINVFSMYYDEEYEGLYVYVSSEESMNLMNGSDSYNYESIRFNEEGFTKDVFAIYEKR